jgi:DUF971 family protein
MSEHPYPVELSKTEDRSLKIVWSDSFTQTLSFRQLRDACRCATCLDKREKAISQPPSINALPVLSAAEARPMDIEQMHPVGNYAYNIHFSDGHSSGIFTFEMLRGLTA